MSRHSVARPPHHRRIALIMALLALISILIACGVGVIGQSNVTAAVTTRTTSNPLLGIDLPVGATLDRLPAGLRDYIRTTWPGLLPETPATNPVPGIDLPTGATRSHLPPGVTDYLHDPTVRRTRDPR